MQRTSFLRAQLALSQSQQASWQREAELSEPGGQLAESVSQPGPVAAESLPPLPTQRAPLQKPPDPRPSPHDCSAVGRQGPSAAGPNGDLPSVQMNAELNSPLGQEADRIFDRIDTGGRGTITREEWREAFKSMTSEERSGLGVALSGDDSSMSTQWSLRGWLSSIGLLDAVKDAICGSDEDAFSLVSVDLSRETLASRLEEHGLKGLAEPIWTQIIKLRQEQADGAERNGAGNSEKFAANEGMVQTYGGLHTFFGGLVAKIGAPSAKIRKGMVDEHTGKTDSDFNFCTSNYAITTTSATEWLFVAHPQEQPSTGWPVEEHIRAARSVRNRSLWHTVEEEVMQSRSRSASIGDAAAAPEGPSDPMEGMRPGPVSARSGGRQAAASGEETPVLRRGMTQTEQLLQRPSLKNLPDVVKQAMKSGVKHRVPMPLDTLQQLLDGRNEQLAKLNEPHLLIEEAFGVRLYTGPMYLVCFSAVPAPQPSMEVPSRPLSAGCVILTARRNTMRSYAASIAPSRPCRNGS